MASSWAIKGPSGKVVRLDDLPVEDLDRIALEAGLESWFDMWYQPLRYGKAAIALYRHCCALVGDEPQEPVTPSVLMESLDRVDEDTPQQWTDGHPQTADDPKTA
jgi:hypothetical protein